jgi:hypothetical protein
VGHILDYQKGGLGYNIEGRTLNSLTIFGVEPVIQWKFGDAWIAAADVLFTVAWQNAIAPSTRAFPSTGTGTRAAKRSRAKPSVAIESLAVPTVLWYR